MVSLIVKGASLDIPKANYPYLLLTIDDVIVFHIY